MRSAGRERRRIIAIRAIVSDRDGPCRIGKNLLAAMGPCGGPSEWAHLNQYRRFKTRGMEPEDRHRTGGTCMLCRDHHAWYDGRLHYPRIKIEFLTPSEADGPLRFTMVLSSGQHRVFEESSHAKERIPDPDTSLREHRLGVPGADKPKSKTPSGINTVWWGESRPFFRKLE